jgi:putative transposase
MATERVYYHVVFTVTRGKPVFLNDEIDATFKQLAREIAHQKGWNLIELETMPNHVHLLVEKAPWEDLSQIVRQVKGVSARRLQQRFPWLHGELNSDHFWNRGYHYTRHTDASLATVQTYIRNQRRAGGLTD